MLLLLFIIVQTLTSNVIIKKFLKFDSLSSISYNLQCIYVDLFYGHRDIKFYPSTP